LLFSLSTGGGLLWHLGMSGSLRLSSEQEPAGRHDHIEFQLGKYYLRFNDPRRFGFVLWVDDFKVEPLLQRLGLEPLSAGFSAGYLHRVLKNKRVAIKTMLMNHTLVAGIGNIYANEICFHAKLHPLMSVQHLTSKKRQRLVVAIRQVLKAAIRAGGTTLKDFVDPRGQPGYFKQKLFVYGWEDEPCLVCGKAITKVTLNQRSTFFCAQCQKRDK